MGSILQVKVAVAVMAAIIDFKNKRITKHSFKLYYESVMPLKA